MGKKVVPQRIEIAGKRQMQQLVSLLVNEGYEVVVYADDHQRANKTDLDRGYIVRYVHPDYDAAIFIAKELK